MTNHTTPNGVPNSFPHSGRAGHIPPARRARRGVSLVAAGIAIAGLSVTPVLLTTTVGTASAQQETPEQRCARQTAEYNQAMDTAWRAAHPGQTPPAGAWPAFVCQEIPQPPAGGGGTTGGGATGGGSDSGVPGRDHQYEGFGNPDSQYQQDMEVGAPRTGLADRTGSADPTTAPRAADTARSNVPAVPEWASPREVTITGADGDTRQVRVIDTDQGVAVIDGAGVATGDMLTTGGSDDDDNGAPSTRGVEGLAGVNLLDQRSTDSSSGPDDGHGPADPMGPGPLGAMAAAAGGIGVLAKRRRTRVGGASRLASGIVHSDGLPNLDGVPGLDSAPRVTINHLTGAEQTIFALLSPESDHTQDFDLDVPPGGDAVIRPDGGVDVVDANGNIVSQVDPPWAYDALGRPQNTWYTYDAETGRLVQHVKPADNALYPIIADPNQNKPRTATQKGEQEGFGDPLALMEQSYFERQGHPLIGDDAVQEIDYDNLQFKSWDGSLHPTYPDYRPSNYNSRPNASNSERMNNLYSSDAIAVYFTKEGRPNARSLHQHYYENTGDEYVLDNSVVDKWITDDHNDYGDGSNNPVSIVTNDRLYSIYYAKKIAKWTGKPVKYSYGGPWRLTAGIDNDHVQSLGHYQMTTSTTVVAYPDGSGKYVQRAYVWDWYNFEHQQESGIAQIASNLGASGEEMGIAKPFEVVGESSVMRGTF